MLYSGIDLHKDMSFITTIKDTGEIIAQQKLPNDPTRILAFFHQQEGPHKAVVEATANWYWLSDLLNGQGIELSLAHAKYLKAISYAKVKTDKVDSQTLAQLLRMDMIPRAHQISTELRPVRDLMRARLLLVTKKTSCINSIHRLLGKYNLSLSSNFKLEDLPTFKAKLEPEPGFQLELLKAQLQLIKEQIAELEKSLSPKLIPDPDIQRLLWIPGIGRILAYTIFLEVDGVSRFPDVKRFWSYSRLVPGANNSNRVNRHKSGNKDGNKYLKTSFTEASVRAIQYYPEIRSFYQSKARKKHKAIARTLVAQELARICYHVLKEGVAYDNRFKGVELSKRKPTGRHSVKWPRLSSPVV